MKVLVINPGGTSTKVAVFHEDKLLVNENISHTQEGLREFENVFQEFEFRKQLVMDVMELHGVDLSTLDAVVGRGGLMKPILGGTYEVNDAMVQDLKDAINGEHASNLGAPLAKDIAEGLSIPAFTVDPVSVDEFMDLARVTGIKDIEKSSWLHSLNHKAVCRESAGEFGKKYEEMNFIVAHLGSGLSVVAHEKGRMVDGSGGRSDGPFSPERSGGLLAYPLINLCYSGKYSHQEMVDKVSRIGGFYDYLGTKDMISIEREALSGNQLYKLILDSFVYQVAKEISMYGATLCGLVDKIILTGGIAHSNYVTKEVERRVSYLAKVEILPGEMEMEALAAGALRVLKNEETAKKYL